MDVAVGMPVAEYLYDEDGEQEITIIGWIKEIGDEEVTIVEAHAFHRLWGGSNNLRGHERTVPASKLHGCPTEYRHIVEEVRSQSGQRRG